jgi:hypothetical protein
MAANNDTTQSASGTLTNHSTPAKKPKIKTTRKAPASGSRAGTTRTSASKPAPAPAVTEIIFKDEPNPYVTPQPPYIWIDFPQQSERLLGPIYNIRLGVGGAEHVDISIDGGVWQTCRLTSGYWWYDWANIQPGRHTLVARMRLPDGRWFRTPTRACEYRP